jgi:aminopeptidase
MIRRAVTPDPRLERYASILVDECVGVQPGWQVLVLGEPLGRPLIEAVTRLIGLRGAYALPRLQLRWVGSPWLQTAPDDLVGELAPLEAHAFRSADAYIAILAPENTRDGSDIPGERLSLFMQARQPHLDPFTSGQKPWVGCQFPTAALAQEAGLSTGEFEQLLFDAVLIDWDELRRRMERIKARFDAAGEVRVRSTGTDVRFSLEGRPGEVSAAHRNMPSGEVYYSPVEDSATGVVHFAEYPAVLAGHQVEGVRLRFEGGRVVEASAVSDEDFLLSALDRDEGARVLGEFGIGCNPGIQRHMRNTLFDEKIEGTVHFALGRGFAYIGGRNESALHWDMVKDLRRGGTIECDGELVQEGGTWVGTLAGIHG